VNYRKIGLFLGAGFVLYFMASQPAESGTLLRSAFRGVGDAASKLAAFVRQTTHSASTTGMVVVSVVMGCTVLGSLWVIGATIADDRRGRRLEARLAENRRRADQIGRQS
jgi:hypothetical protein